MEEISDLPSSPKNFSNATQPSRLSPTQTFGDDEYLVGKIKVELFFHGPLAE